MKSPPASIDLLKDMTSVMRKIDKKAPGTSRLYNKAGMLVLFQSQVFLWLTVNFSYSFRNVEYQKGITLNTLAGIFCFYVFN
ncbi:hypothetical protein [Rhodocytophaga aerolata]|uniref:hypothetical protein n=1 Tax=Rhodocytophaga aerolata TaxID=455078 RepID=UPI00366ED7C2